MIKSVTAVNHLGEAVKVVLDDPNPKHGLLITSIDGLGPAKANINVTNLAVNDGAIYNSARLDYRNIVITFSFLDDIETTRQTTYKYFPIKKYIVLVIETDNNTLMTEGYVESNEPDIFSESEGCQISIICPDPHLHSLENNVAILSPVKSLFEFPYSAGMPQEKQEEIIRTLPSNLEDYHITLTKHDGEAEDDEIEKYGLKIDKFLKVTKRPSESFDYSIDDSDNENVLDREDDPITAAIVYKRYDVEPMISYPYNKVVNAVVTTEDNVTTITFEIIDNYDPLIEFGTYLDPIVEIDYSGSSDIGCVLNLYFSNTVKDNVIVYNELSDTSIQIDVEKFHNYVGTYFLSGDEIVINTNANNKSIYLIRDGEYINILNCITRPFEWITIVNGHNSIYYYTDKLYLSYISGNVTYRTAFEGI